VDIVVTIIAWGSALVFCLYGWDLVVSLAGLLPVPPAPGKRGEPTFAVLICAHDEERVIAGVVASLKAQQYPPDRVKIYVVADHCRDRTAELARAGGAIVLERENQIGRTKGFALQWGIEQIRKLDTHDALSVLDADNVVPPDFLGVLSGYLDSGHVAIQAYLDTKNPTQSWVTRCIATAYYVTNRFWFQARMRLGLSATLGGTGFCLAWQLVDRYPWDPGSLADDLELTMRLIADGVPVSYCYHTRTFDEKPPSLRLSLRQRIRWMQGHNDVSFRWTGPMLKAFLRSRSTIQLDALLHLLQPVRMLLAFLALLILGAFNIALPNHPALADTFYFTLPAISLAAAVFVIYPLVLAASERKLAFTLRIFGPFLLFSFTWIPAIVLGLLRYRRRVWVHTAHGHAKES
jgi:cellulose synthase/poly-beta-1,6-N-acetylglucosamine synthase-like glycosyltransferase